MRKPKMHHQNMVAPGGHCTCCHVCHASEKTSRREFRPCSTCTSIACRPCVEGVGEKWEEVLSNANWSCPKCTATCPCLRCRRKVAAGFLGVDQSPTPNPRPKAVTHLSSVSPVSAAHTHRVHSHHSHKHPKKRRDETLLLLSQHPEVTRKRDPSPDYLERERPRKKRVIKPKQVSRPTSHSPGFDNSELVSYSSLPADFEEDRASSSEGELENDFAEELWNFQEADRKRLEDLISRNQRCTEFIKRTEHLLRLIRTEQGNILNQLKLFRKIKGRRSRTTTPSPGPLAEERNSSPSPPTPLPLPSEVGSCSSVSPSSPERAPVEDQNTPTPSTNVMKHHLKKASPLLVHSAATTDVIPLNPNPTVIAGTAATPGSLLSYPPALRTFDIL